jgi:uncharacterized protein
MKDLLLMMRNLVMGRVVLLVVSMMLFGCASSPMIQPRINSFVVAERYDLALELLESNQSAYGSRNELLYQLDLGLVLHYAGEYARSVRAFENAKRIHQRLYTVSVSNYASTWLVNDNRAPYRGEDFERVLLNVFQSLNFAAMGRWEEALVEARDADERLRLMRNQRIPGQVDGFWEDAFVRMLMGMIHQSLGGRERINDAFISYQKSWAGYRSEFYKKSGVSVPTILKKRWLETASLLGWEDRLPAEVAGAGVEDVDHPLGASARLVVVYYQGLSPIKRQVSIPVPLPNGNIARFAFPQFMERGSVQKTMVVKAVDARGYSTTASTELGQNITEIAKRDLRARQVGVIAKAVGRQAGKQVAIDAIETMVRAEQGSTAGSATKIVGNLYAYFSEQPDLRSWQTLPAGIQIASLELKPGRYTVFGDEEIIRDNVELKEDQTVFLLWRSTN